MNINELLDLGLEAADKYSLEALKNLG